MKNKPIPFPVSGREEVFYSLLEEEKLLELFALYDKIGFTDQLNCVAHEMRKRAERGELEIFNHSPTIVHDVPGWLQRWPFSLLWSQKRSGGGE
jgi:hypothetical protein